MDPRVRSPRTRLKAPKSEEAQFLSFCAPLRTHQKSGDLRVGFSVVPCTLFKHHSASLPGLSGELSGNHTSCSIHFGFVSCDRDKLPDNWGTKNTTKLAPFDASIRLRPDCGYRSTLAYSDAPVSYFLCLNGPVARSSSGENDRTGFSISATPGSTQGHKHNLNA